MLNDMVCVSHCYEHIYIFYNYKHEYPVVDIWTVFYYPVCFDTYSSMLFASITNKCRLCMLSGLIFEFIS
jgi:hypothetical protein